VVLAALVSLLLHSVGHQPGTPLFLVAIICSAWYGGLGPGLVATACAALSVDYLRQQWWSPEFGLDEVMRLGLFVFTALFITLVNEVHVRVLSREHQARAQAEETARIKDRFLAMVSHELRTPLNAISGWATILSRDDCDALTSARAKEAIKRNSISLSHLINDLLDASRAMTGKLLTEVQLVRLAPILEDSVDTVRPEVVAKGIQLVTDFEVPVDSVLGDPNRLKQVFGNILTNALKFTPAGGSIEVRLRSAGPSKIHIIISDDGIGIRREELPYVFDSFRQADNAVRYGGLGLGLTIVRQLVELHGGTIEASSGGEGCGARFTVELPLAEATQTEVNSFDPNRD
jgi:signal transduction histidine kinase